MADALAAAPQALAVERVAEADLAAAISRLEGTPLAADGKVGVIGLEAIRDRLGERWAGRRAHIHEHVERTLTRHLGVGAWFAKISDVEYLLVQPSLSRYAAQASCLSYMRDLLEHFLGRFSPAELKVLEVRKLSAAGLEAQVLDPHAIAEAAGEETRKTLAAQAEASAVPPALNPFTAADGQMLRVSCHLEPIFRLADFVQIGYRLNRQVIDERSGLPLSHLALSRLTTSDLEKIDLATISRGFNRLGSERSGGGKPILTLPVFFSTLSSQKARRALINCLQISRQTTNVRLYCAIQRLEGVPPSVLSSAISLMRPFCDGIIGGVEKPQRSAAALRGIGLAGIAFDYVGPPGSEPEKMAPVLGPAVEAAAAVCPLVIVLGLKSPSELGVAGLVGATYATLVPPEPVRGA
jgi:hypothetical protein